MRDGTTEDDLLIGRLFVDAEAPSVECSRCRTLSMCTSLVDFIGSPLGEYPMPTEWRRRDSCLIVSMWVDGIAGMVDAPFSLNAFFGLDVSGLAAPKEEGRVCEWAGRLLGSAISVREPDALLIVAVLLAVLLRRKCVRGLNPEPNRDGVGVTALGEFDALTGDADCGGKADAAIGVVAGAVTTTVGNAVFDEGTAVEPEEEGGVSWGDAVLVASLSNGDVELSV